MSLATTISTVEPPPLIIALLVIRAAILPIKRIAKPLFRTNAMPMECGEFIKRFFLVSFSLYCGMGLRLHAVDTNWAAKARQEFVQKQSEYKSKPEDPQAAWQFGRSCFDLAEFASNKTERATLAQQGIDACRNALAADSNAAPAHYYLALNQGQLARTRSLGALRLVTQMERELLKAIAENANFDYAGPERTLGLLYRDAPSFGSIGNRTKARQHLQRAVELAPDFPDNRLALLESYLRWGEPDGARRELKALKEAWARAQGELNGPNWQASWADWQERLEKAQKKLDETKAGAG